MTNTLSQEICEICGVRPKKDCSLCPHAPLHPGKMICDKCNYVGLTYPDFAKPENFVRLLELPVDNPKTTDIKIIDMMLTSYAYIDRENFLNEFFSCLKNEFCPSHYRVNLDYIKQSIKQAEWEY